MFFSNRFIDGSRHTENTISLLLPFETENLVQPYRGKGVLFCCSFPMGRLFLQENQID